MNKKVGPLPLWAWVGLLAALGYGLYRYEKQRSEEYSGVEEGVAPTLGVPERVESGGSGGGVSAAEEFQARLAEGAEGRAIGREERAEERAEGRASREEGFAARAEERREAFERWAAQFAKGTSGKGTTRGKAGKRHREGKGAVTNRGNRNNGNAGQRSHGNHSNHQPGHVAKSAHLAAAHPASRIDVGQSRLMPIGVSRKRRR